MGQIKGFLWLCESCLNDDVSNSEAKCNLLIDTKGVKTGMKSIHDSLTEKEFALRPTPEPVKIHGKEDNLSRQVFINCLFEEKRFFNSSVEADNFKLQIVINHMAERTLKIDSTCTLKKPKGDKSQPRPLLVRFTADWDAGNCLPKR